jgi:hypothetical protein
VTWLHSVRYLFLLLFAGAVAALFYLTLARNA